MSDTPLSVLLSPQLLARIDDYRLLARVAVEGLLAGLQRSRKAGGGCEFLQYREYVAGDELKYLDWKLLARQGKAYTKQFQQETNMRCAILIDASASMGYRGEKAACEKFRYAAIIAACIAYLAQKQGDQVSLCVYADTELLSQPGSRNYSVGGLLSALGRISVAGTTDHELAVQFVDKALKRRSLIVWLSDFHHYETQLGDSLSRFRLSGHDSMLCQVLDEDELNLPFNRTLRYVDSESNREISTNAGLIRQAYKQRLGRFLEDTRRCCLEQQCDYLLACTADNIGELLAAWLDKREGML
ncbi:MAG: DUF58 domain-containing protein [Oligosphaeraceae bacterium]|nr:DUF58 domain-containing protein [Oligosphaeraceae bacterium]